MKKMIIALVVLLIAAPSMAAVTISASAVGNEVTVSFSNSGATNVRAIALDIETDNAAVITAVTEVNGEYTIYPGSIVIDVCDITDAGDGVVTDGGSAVCSASYPGTLTGLGTTGMTIEMASLYDGAPNAPAQSGTVVKFTVDSSCNITISENVIRGGIVMEDPDEDPADNLPITVDANVGCPCVGDIVDDTASGNPVTTNDLFVMINDLTFDVTAPLLEIWPGDPGYKECADVLNDGKVGAVTTNDCFWLINELTKSSAAPIPCMPAP